ncbi:transcriptional regulatory protein CitT [Halobacillus andaensis]|uniref:Transcriptional regulatory protein CitT n=1 Tax=Halobacillus andaensis TaxID=1176239 RepID=A0A917EZN4_HALAA|nr:response regulator [Halobacillus andaensis]MBP2005225.1 CitB family two-component system response regulator CitT [Halobacillus andaensis]GGF29818.1 transcriptional regulatory protein CitT [Halobacillus andaensis]
MIKAVIAEDDFRVADLHEKFLKEVDGIEVVAKALNAEEALQAVHQHRPDLLLLDVYMPDRLGTELLHELRKTFPALDIIMITAATEKEMITKALNYGVVDYIIKPISMDRFLHTIETYQKKKHLMNSQETFDQKTVDQLIGNETPDEPEEASVPKGIDQLTLKKVRQLLKDNADEGITAEQASHHMGASKTTARRYLEYLIYINEGVAEMRYGKVGRPERKYFYHQ